MNTNRLILLFATLLAGQALAADIMSTFESTDEGWTVIGLAGTSYAQTVAGPLSPTFSNSGGNPDGHVFFTDVPGVDFWFEAPAKFLGVQAANYGLRLAYDVRAVGGAGDWEDADVVLIGTNGIVLVADTGSNPDSNWSRRSISLTESAGWRIALLSGEVPTKSEFLAVLTGLSALRIRGEFKSETDVGYLDNVAMEAGVRALSIRVSQVEICWNSSLGRLYQIQWSTEIQPTVWSGLGNPIPGTGTRIYAQDPVTDGQPRRFYRVLELP